MRRTQRSRRRKVNVNCGSTHIESLQKSKPRRIRLCLRRRRRQGYCRRKRQIYDGDAMLLALSTLYRLQGKLKNVLSSARFYRTRNFKENLRIKTLLSCARTWAIKRFGRAFGTRLYVGRRKSGHILMLDKENTGDGLVTALSLLEVKRTVGSLPKFTPYPMLELNVCADNPSKLWQAAIFKKNKQSQRSVRKIGQARRAPKRNRTVHQNNLRMFSSSPDAIFDEIKRIFKPNHLHVFGSASTRVERLAI